MKTKENITIILLSIMLSLMLLSCQNDKASEGVSGGTGNDSGKGGSMARFAITGDHLYAVNNNTMNLFNIQDPFKPTLNSVVNIGWGIETIFPYQNYLFIGSSTGMYIYNNSNPSSPQFLSNYRHVYSCDPVVVDGAYAYVTLRNGSSCQTGVNRLDIVSLNDPRNPLLIKSYNMTNPYGLGIDGKTLFVCDNGLSVYNVENPLNIQLTAHFNITAYDVIPQNGLLMVIGKDGLYQYSYTNNEIKELSKLSLPLNRL